MLPEDLPVAEFAFPGPLRDQLVAAILAGNKTTTTGLVADYEHDGEPVPRPGLREAVADSAGNHVAVIETTAVRVIRLGDVDLAHAVGEGEGTPRSLKGGLGTSSSGSRRKCAKPWVTRNSRSRTTPWWWPRRSGWSRSASRHNQPRRPLMLLVVRQISVCPGLAALPSRGI